MDSETPLDPGRTSHQSPGKRQTPPPRGTKRRLASPAPTGRAHPNQSGSTGIADTASSSSASRKAAKITASSGEMQTSHPERLSAVKFTKTGRLSRANKGRRVHACVECGKTYTRAEHLRRHQQNHKAGVFSCDSEGCDRSFNREDLLTRHKARHNEPYDTQGRPASVMSHPSVSLDGSSGGTHLIPSVVSDADVQPSPVTVQRNAPLSTTQSVNNSAPTRKAYIPFSELGMDLAISVDGNTGAGYPGCWPASPSYSSGYESPERELSFGGDLTYHTSPYAARDRNSSNAMMNGAWAPSTGCHSPGSVNSSAYFPQWVNASSQHFTHVLAHPGTSPESDFSCENTISACHSIYGQPQYNPFLVTEPTQITKVLERDTMEETLLALPTAQISTNIDIGVDVASTKDEATYLATYWHWLHPQFPIIEQSSYSRQTASPLLHAAMLALGAHLQYTRDGCNHGRVVHERCKKALNQRTSQRCHTFHACDMQAIILIELFSVFRSRRPPLELSNEFQTVYRRLVHDTQITEKELTTIENKFAFVHDLTMKQHMLLACYVLDQQHSSLFGRPAAECLVMPGMNLPFPATHFEFRAPFGSLVPPHWPRMLYQAIGERAGIVATAEAPSDAFQSSLMLFCLADPNTNLELCGLDPDDDAEVSLLFLSMDQSARTKLIYHASMLCKNTPIRQLLAVAGESWIMAEKLGSQAEFMLIQHEAKQWAEGGLAKGTTAHSLGPQASIERALHHAMEIIRIHMYHPRTGLLYQEWAIYLATIVIWARAYVMSSTKHAVPRLSIPSPTETRHSQTNVRGLEHHVASLLEAGPTCGFGENEATDVLLWTKDKIEKVNVPHNWGVTNGALDVLSKLVLRGHEPGWFGA